MDKVVYLGNTVEILIEKLTAIKELYGGECRVVLMVHPAGDYSNPLYTGCFNLMGPVVTIKEAIGVESAPCEAILIDVMTLPKNSEIPTKEVIQLPYKYESYY